MAVVEDSKFSARKTAEILRVLEEHNMENKNSPGCYKCAYMTVNDRHEDFGKVTDYQKGMKIVGVSKVRVFKSRDLEKWGAMVDWKCPLGHGTSVGFREEDMGDQTVDEFVDGMRKSLKG